VTAISTNISSVRKNNDRQPSVRETRLAQLMKRYLYARERKNITLDEVRSLYHQIREKGDSAAAKLKLQYKQAVVDLTQNRQEASRLHSELVEALTRGFTDLNYEQDRRAAS
jgi:hypothetical protein